MNILRFQLYCLILFILLSCSKKNNNTTYSCSYSILENSTNEITKNNGSRLSGNFSIKLEGNLKKILGDYNLATGIEDTTFINFIESKTNSEIKYSSFFLEKHNAIIGILCSIEKRIQNDSLSFSERESLIQESIDYRKRFMDLLLEIEIVEINNKPSKEEIVDPNVQLDRNRKITFGFSARHKPYTEGISLLIEKESNLIFKEEMPDYLISFETDGNIEAVRYNSLYKFTGGNLKVLINGEQCIILKSSSFEIESTLRSGNDRNKIKEQINLSINLMLQEKYNLFYKKILECIN